MLKRRNQNDASILTLEHEGCKNNILVYSFYTHNILFIISQIPKIVYERILLRVSYSPPTYLLRTKSKAVCACVRFLRHGKRYVNFLIFHNIPIIGFCVCESEGCFMLNTSHFHLPTI